jgi:hypothetical protein
MDAKSAKTTFFTDVDVFKNGMHLRRKNNRDRESETKFWQGGIAPSSLEICRRVGGSRESPKTFFAIGLLSVLRLSRDKHRKSLVLSLVCPQVSNTWAIALLERIGRYLKLSLQAALHFLPNALLLPAYHRRRIESNIKATTSPTF